jgi:hypothetical protein
VLENTPILKGFTSGALQGNAANLAHEAACYILELIVRQEDGQSVALEVLAWLVDRLSLNARRQHAEATERAWQAGNAAMSYAEWLARRLWIAPDVAPDPPTPPPVPELPQPGSIAIDEFLAVGIHQIVADADHQPYHMALVRELQRLYRAAGEPAPRPLRVPDGLTAVYDGPITLTFRAEDANVSGA